MERITRRSPYEVVIRPEVNTHVRQRTAVKVVFAPTWEQAAEKLLETINSEGT